MTKKHFEALAREFKAAYPLPDLIVEGKTAEEREILACRAGWFKTVSAVIKVAEEFNPKFDRKKFCLACGLKYNV